jgi:hypothetical protein
MWHVKTHIEFSLLSEYYAKIAAILSYTRLWLDNHALEDVSNQRKPLVKNIVYW